jgi:hypothetical protein
MSYKMTRKQTRITRPSHIAAVAAGLVMIAASAQAASEQTRRNSNTIQNYQNQQQGPYYNGRTNSYYGTSTQAPQPQSNPASTNATINQIRRNEHQQGR